MTQVITDSASRGKGCRVNALNNCQLLGSFVLQVGCYHITNFLVLGPVFNLALPNIGTISFSFKPKIHEPPAVPLVLAPRAPLSCRFATQSTLGVLHQGIEDVQVVGTRQANYVVNSLKY